MRKVKCGMKNAEQRWLVNTKDHVTAAITQFTIRNAWTAQWWNAYAESNFFYTVHVIVNVYD